MVSKRFTEKNLLKNLDERNSHADEMAELLPQELEPLERLRDSVTRYIRPTDPVWDEYVDSDAGVADAFKEGCEQKSPVQNNDQG